MKYRLGPNPLLYFLLFLPFGAASGFVSITLGALADRAGIGVGAISAMVGMTLVPQFAKFLWAPLIDALATPKRWYIGANLVSAATLVTFGLIPMSPENLGLLQLLVFVNSIASSFVAMSVEALIAHATPPAELGRAGGWSQAGNLGGGGLGGGLALILAVKLPEVWMATAALGALMLLCSLALPAVPDVIRKTGGKSLEARFREVGADIKELFKHPGSVVPLALCFLPAGCAAASGLFSAIASEWNASVEMVAWMNGPASGLIMIPGALLGGRLSDSMNRYGAYALVGGMLSLVTLAVVFMPKVPMTYAFLCVSYSFVTGLAYGTFSAFVLAAIGGGAAATKYNVFASIANFPIWYMTRLDGWVADEWGTTHMLFFDAAAGVVGLMLVGLVVVRLRFRPAPPLPAAKVVK